MGLQISDLNNLPANNTGQSLQQLITYYNYQNHNSLPAARNHAIDQINAFLYHLDNDSNINLSDAELTSELLTRGIITNPLHRWKNYLLAASSLDEAAMREKEVLTFASQLAINKLRVSEQSQINRQSALLSHIYSPCSLNHLPEPHQCPIVNKIDCSHTDYETIKQQRDNCQTQLENQEQALVQRLNTVFNLQAQDLDHAISKLKELIDKPPLTVDNEIIKQEFIKSQQIITKLEQQLQDMPMSQKTIGENIKEIIKIDEKLLNENANLKIELNKQTKDYEQLAQERNRLVLQQIKDINIEKTAQLLPQAEKQEIKTTLEKAKNYEQLAQQRNQLITKYINQNTQPQIINPEQLPLNNHSERVIWISLLVVSLVSIGGLLVKLRGTRKA